MMDSPKQMYDSSGNGGSAEGKGRVLDRKVI